MNESWYAVPGTWAYACAAAAFAWLALRLVVKWQPGGKPAMLLMVAVSSMAAAAASAVFIVWPTVTYGWVAALLEFVRVGVTLGFLLVFLGARGGRAGARGSGGWASLLGVGLLLLALWLLVGVRPPGLPWPSPFAAELGFGSALGVAAFGLVLLEQCYRRTPTGGRWQIRPLILGLAGLFAFDVALYSDALLFRTLSRELWMTRGFAQAMSVGLALVTLSRRVDWSFDLSVSRGVVAGSSALLLTGGYLLVASGAGLLLRLFGGSWGTALQALAAFGALLLLATLLLSTTFRAKVRVLVAKHFFTYRYNYREEWLRLTNALTAGASDRPWAACISALGNLVESPGGALWFHSGEGVYRQVERAGFPTIAEPLPEADPLPAFLRRTGWIVDLKEAKNGAVEYGGLEVPPVLADARDAWLVVPLLTGSDLVGFVVLSSPRVRIELDWEVLDLLKTAGRQAAGYLAYARATESLLEAQKFEAFHRMSTFVVHDLKNLIAQLQLLVSNAERHRDNPDFQRDMLKTIEHVVGRMHHLILQLKPEASPRDRVQPVDVAAIVRRVESLRLGGRKGLTVTLPDTALLAWAHEDLLERVISHLMQNAFDASDHSPDVRVVAESAGERVLIEVTDRGQGMTEEFMRERLFRPFQTTKATGMGIGVYECRQYVQQVGGRIEFDSAEGAGTRVRVHLRAVASASAQAGAAA